MKPTSKKLEKAGFEQARPGDKLFRKVKVFMVFIGPTISCSEKKKVLMIFVVMAQCSQGFIEIINIKHLLLCFSKKTKWLLKILTW